MSPPLPPPAPLLYNNHTRPPLLFVTHLPSASSFYAAIIQPLGLQILPPSPTSPHTLPIAPHTITNPVLNYGYLAQGPAGLKTVVVFSITGIGGQRQGFRPAKITLSASSEEAVRQFWKKSGLVNKGVRTPAKLEFLQEQGGEGIVARTRDFDGNMLEAIYRPRDKGVSYGGGGYSRPVIETAATEREARRVLEWQEQVARSIGESGGSGGAASVYSSSDIEGGYRPAVVRRADSYPVQGSEKPLRLVRRETVTTEHYRRPDERGEGRRGMSGKAVIGTLLGAAAGAAFAYAMVRSESPERRPLAPPRRASYGNESERIYTHVTQSPRESIPARSYVSARDEGRPRYVDVEYVGAAPRVHQIEEKSYVSQRPGRSVEGRSRARSRSEAGPRYERPLTILPARTQSRARSPSHLSQRSSYKTARERSPSRSRKTASHISSRSYHSHSTTKPSPPPPVSTSTIKIRAMPSERERRVMHSGFERDVERARRVPLPMSVVNGPGYAVSVAPSDSVSSVGIKRERERLRERMSIRDGVPRGW
jgi:hypothetical protein